MKHLFLLVIIASVLFSCDEEEATTFEGELEYGTSFGECIGYCLTETYLNGTLLTIEQKTWVDDQEIVHKRILTSEEQQSILAGINEEKFLGLDEVIGCPDCADGGAEWLEITGDGEQKRVTFEYMSEIDGINPAIEKLRAIVGEVLED